VSAQLRKRLWVAGVLVVVVVVVASVALVRSRSQGCSLAAPVPDLPAQLRALANFDRPYDLGDERTLGEVAAQAAAALHPDLIGSSAERAVPVSAASPDLHDAVVVPLMVTPSTGPRHLAGAVAFLLDCSRSAYFSGVEDVSATTPWITDFPAVTRDFAATSLRAANPVLSYSQSPFRPIWRDPQSGREIPAGG
jgi:hypothetical protein